MQLISQLPFLLLICKICPGPIGIFVLAKPERHFIGVGKIPMKDRVLDVFIGGGVEGHGRGQQLTVTHVHVKCAARQVRLLSKFYRDRHSITAVSVSQRRVDQLLAADDRLLQGEIQRAARVIGRIHRQNDIVSGGDDLLIKVQRKIDAVSHQLDKTVFQCQASVIKGQDLRSRIGNSPLIGIRGVSRHLRRILRTARAQQHTGREKKHKVLNFFHLPSHVLSVGFYK